MGEFQISIELDHNIIKDINIAGDFFVLGSIDESIIAPLKGVSYTREALTEALKDLDASTVIARMSTEQLINTILN